MNIIISESQLRFLLENNNKSSLSEDIKSLYDFTKDIVNKSKDKFGIDLTLLMTWGAAVGGLVMPLDNYIRTGEFDLTEDQLTLILIGCISTLFLDNKRMFQKVYKKCKEEGIEGILDQVVNKGSELKKSFIRFLSSLNLSIKNVTSLVRYSFLIPIISDLQSIGGDGDDIKIISLRIAERILAAGVITISVETLSKLVEKILKKIS
jgi:hypothetical protein